MILLKIIYYRKKMPLFSIIELPFLQILSLLLVMWQDYPGGAGSGADERLDVQARVGCWIGC